MIFWLQSFAYLTPPPPVPQSETVDDFLIVWVYARFPFPFTFSFTLALGDVQLVVVPRSFLDQRIQLVLKVSVEEAKVFFPFLPRSCAE